MTNDNIIDITSISNKKGKKLIKKLTKEINKYNEAYYIKNESIISDAKYDQLLDLLKALEKKFPKFITKSNIEKVGADSSVQSKFKKHIHKEAMLSLDNAFSEQDIEKFITKINRFLKITTFPIICCEPKIDGVSFSATYSKGKLIKGATRGNGYIGEDITENIKTIKNLPHIINNNLNSLEIRGEIYLEKEDFDDLNIKQQQLGKEKFSNLRNAASGSLRQLDHNVTANRPLKYFAYSIGTINSFFIKDQIEVLNKLTNLGFNVNPLYVSAKSIKDMLNFYQKIIAIRDTLKYEIDGVVYKINNFTLQRRLGSTNKSPRFSIAYKFPALIEETKLLNISIQVGRTGILTPIAKLKPLDIGGVKISKASLHNHQQIKKLDIRIGDTVKVYRAGEVIPKILSINIKKRDTNSSPFIFPTYCPSCKSQLLINEKKPIIRCNNGLNCPKQIEESIIHFVNKNAMNIEGLGKKRIRFLLEHKMISSIPDIFLLEKNNHINKLHTITGWGIKSTQKLFEHINLSKTIALEKFIYAIGIKNIGQNHAKTLSREFKTIDMFFKSMLELAKHNKNIYNQLYSLEDISTNKINNLKNFFLCEQNINIIKQLLLILIITNYKENKQGLLFRNEIIIFSGKLKLFSRNEAKVKAQQLGAQISSSITTKTTLLIVGENPGSKVREATKLGIKIISEQEWYNIINNK